MAYTQFIYRVWCSKCNHEHSRTEDHDYTDDTFLTNFFLGNDCPNCASFKPWYKSYGKYERVCDFSLFHPSTWFSGWTWVEKRGKLLDGYYD